MTNENFRFIVRQYEKLVFSICFQFTKDYYEAENLTQETFISAFNHIDGCDPEKYRPWLCRIATNKAKDYLKTSYKKHVELSQDGDIIKEDFGGGIQPEKSLIVQEGVESISKTINELKEPYKLVSVMFFLEGKSYEEIGKTLKRPPKTVQTQVLRAKELLKIKLKGGL